MPVDRYRDFVEYAGPSARRQGVSGLHIHVGMPDSATCFRVMETILPWLPFVLAVVIYLVLRRRERAALALSFSTPPA